MPFIWQRVSNKNDQQQVAMLIAKGDIVRPELLCDKGEFLTERKITKLMPE